MYQLSRLLHDHYRDLYNHLERYEIAPTFYAAPWFLTLFASQFPLGFVARVFGKYCHLQLVLKTKSFLINTKLHLVVYFFYHGYHLSFVSSSFS